MAPAPSRAGSGEGRTGPGRGGGTAGIGRRARPGSAAGGVAPSAVDARGLTREMGPWLHEPRSPGDGRMGLRSRASTDPSPSATPWDSGIASTRSVSPRSDAAAGRGRASLRATIAADGPPPREPALAGAAPSALERPPDRGQDPARQPLPHPAPPLPADRAPPRAPARDEGVPRRVDRAARWRDHLGRERPGGAVRLVGRAGLRWLRDAGLGRGREPDAERRPGGRRRADDPATGAAVHQRGDGRPDRE